jgi:hypothetical protein
MGEQFGGDPRVFGEDLIGAAKNVGCARAQIAEIADRRRDDVQSGR